MTRSFMDCSETTELPEGWASAELRELVEDVQPGFACGAYNREGEGIGHLRPMNVTEEGQVDLSVLKFVPNAEVHRDERLVRAGDVVFNNTNSPELVGKTALYTLSQPRAFSNHMTRVRCRTDGLEPAFCAMYLHQQWRTGYFLSVCNNHVSQASVASGVLLNTPLVIPPLAEQKRIVAKVEELLGRVGAARERLAKVPALLKRFRQSVLAAACSGQLTADWPDKKPPERKTIEKCDTQEGLPRGWSLRLLRDITERLEQGWSPKCDIQPSPSAETWGVIKTTAVQPLRFVEHENKQLPSSLTPREELEIEAGDLLTTRAGPRVRAAVTCFVHATRRRLIVCDKVYRFRVDEGKVKPEFVAMCLNAPIMIELLDSLKTGISDSGVNLTQQKFLSLELQLPPLREQAEIVRRVDALFTLADKIEARVEAAKARVEKSTQAILAKAFRGELVPTEAELARQQGRDYEPASVLLERIRKEREAASATQRRNKPRRRNSPRRKT